MRSFRCLLASLAGRGLVGLLATLTGLLGCPPRNPPLGPEPGILEYREIAALRVPGGVVNVMGGNLLVRRVDLSIDTRLGTREIGAIYNSSLGAWLWDFDLRYDGASFLDPSGALHATGSLPAGSAIPGTVWVVADGDTIETKGGLAHDFDSDGRLAAIHWRGSPYPRLAMLSATIAGAPRTTRIRQCTAASACSDVYTIGYDAAGRVVSIGDRAGRLASFTWDPQGRLVVARDALDIARAWPGFRYEYWGLDLMALTNSENERIEFRYAGGRITRVVPGGGANPFWHFAYEGRTDGLYRTRVTNPLGQEVRYRYDVARRLHQVEDMATGELTERLWNGLRVATEIRPDGVATSWTWANDDAATRLDPSGNVTTYGYAPAGVDRDSPFQRPIASVSDSLGLVEQRAYDAQGRLVAITNGAGETASLAYGADGLVERITTLEGVVRHTLERGEHGHAQRILVGERERLRTFDAVGNPLEGPSEDLEPLPGGWIERAYDEDRNLAGILLGDTTTLGRVNTTAWLTIEHRSDGRRTAIRRPGGGDHEFVYDALGRLVGERERVDGQWRISLREWDAVGRPTAVQRPNGMREELVWDAAGRIVVRRALRNGVLEGTAEFGWESGRLVSLEDSLVGGGETYFYDPAGRLLSVRYPGGEQLFFGWDARSRKTRELYLMPDWSVLRDLGFAYDLADREVSLSDQGVPVLERSWQGSRVVRTSYGNGLVRDYAYDAGDGRPVGSSTLDAALQPVEETTIEEDDGGWIVHLGIKATTTTWGGVAATTIERYGIAPIAIDPYLDSGPRVWIWSAELLGTMYFGYDHLGNMNATTFGGTPFVYNAERNRLLSANPHGAGAIDYTWDAAGFATSRGGQPITWTATGRMASFGEDVELEWDMLGRLVSSRVEGAEARFRFGGRVQADAAGAPTSLDLGEVRIDLASDSRLYRHFDFRENVKFLTDDAGEVVAHYHYGPYGLFRVFGADDDPVRFVGRPEIGELMILGLRIYDPAVGRFLSPDPILQLESQFAYTLGNPVMFTDAEGSHLTLADAIVAIALGILSTAIYAAAPELAVMMAIFVLLAYLIGALNADFAQAVGSTATSGVSQPSGAGSSSSSSSCAPARLSEVPDVGPLLAWLVPVQLLLGLLLLRRRRRRSP